MAPHEMMAALLTALHYPAARLARETGIARTTVSRMLSGETLGTSAHRRALTAWGRAHGLLRPGEQWWSGMHRAATEHEVSRAIARAVGAGLDRCPACGSSLSIPPAPGEPAVGVVPADGQTGHLCRSEAGQGDCGEPAPAQPVPAGAGQPRGEK